VMNKLPIKKIAPLFLLLLSGALFLQFTLSGKAQRPDDGRFSEKVNLALRRTAHYMLRASGDSTSRIPPVEQTGGATWMIRLGRSFSYDSLPSLLNASFDVHGIAYDYDVAVFDCADSTLQLGYNNHDYLTNQEAPCGGREQSGDCYRLLVTFALPPQPLGQNPLWGWLAAGFLVTGLAMAAWKGKKKSQAVESELLVFGNSSLDAANQQLVSGGIRYELTYRETKLLHLFCSRPNLLLEREFILQSVWADEGILVGRSVDMFVSRLRKMLRSDPTVRIATVHGVGYRLEA
jgi:hypothetical protein